MTGNVEEYVANPTKRHIIGELMKHGKLKYSQLLPEGTDNVLFNYHLQHLVKSGLLLKEENYYSFTPEGFIATTHLTYEGLSFPKFTCRYRMYVIDGDRVLLQHRTLSPFKGEITGISSKLMYGTSSSERASFRIKEKTNLETEMKLAGTLRTLIYNSEKVILEDCIYFIMYATSFSGESFEKDDNGNPLVWYSFDEAIKLEEKNKWSGEKSVEIIKRLCKGNFQSFAFEEEILADSL